MEPMRARGVLWPLLLMAAGCGSSKITTVNTPPTASESPPPPPVIVITARGVDQQVLHVFEGHATFVNDDTQGHALYLDPHPTHNPSAADCSAPNLGMIPAGTRVEITNLRP